MLKTKPNTHHLDAIFSALSDPTRRAMLARLASGEATVQELAGPFEMSLPGVSKHLKVLEGAGLISRSRKAQQRPCKLEAEPLREVEDWMEHYRRFWDESFDRLDDYLKVVASQSPGQARGKEASQPKGGLRGASGSARGAPPTVVQKEKKKGKEHGQRD